jgi:nitrite reductase (NADH) small subunit
MSPNDELRWTPLCPLSELTAERGVAALIDGRQIAVFLLHDGSVHAVDHADPFSGANVIARGIVGSRTVDGTQVATVASPLHKQVFDLTTGVAFDDPDTRLAVYPVRVRDGLVEVMLPATQPPAIQPSDLSDRVSA